MAPTEVEAPPAGSRFGRLLRNTIRRRHYDGDLMETKLRRCLGTAEITFFGVANMIGCGIFVLTGNLLRIAGPAGLLSYFLAGFSSVLAGMCYAELASAIPKAGSCYTYTYFALGEVFAFIIGWTLISDSIISFAAISKAFSAAVDVLSGNAISNGTINAFGRINVPVLAEYPDFVAAALVIVLVTVIACGAKDSLIVNSTMTAILLVLLVIIIVSTFVLGSHIEYWTDKSIAGGFMPFGLTGVLEGASICVFTFGGFDAIANTSEEARKPHYSIPRAMALGLLIVAVLYCSACAGLSLLVTQYTVDVRSPFAYAFLQSNQTWLYYVSSVATIFATSDVSGLYSVPRMLFSLANDGLLFPIFARVSERTKVPWVSLIAGGAFTIVLALLINIESLAEMTSVGLLLSYMTVGIDILIVRYNGMVVDGKLPAVVQFKSQSQNGGFFLGKKTESTCSIINASISVANSIQNIAANAESRADLVQQYPRFRKRFHWMRKVCDAVHITEKQLCDLSIGVFVACSVVITTVLVFGLSTEVAGLWWFLVAFLLPSAGATMLLSILALTSLKAAKKAGTFNLPLMPITPCLTIFINMLLILNIQSITWLRFILWIVIGLLIYFAYGVKHSTASDGKATASASAAEFTQLEEPNNGLALDFGNKSAAQHINGAFDAGNSDSAASFH